MLEIFSNFKPARLNFGTYWQGKTWKTWLYNVQSRTKKETFPTSIWEFRYDSLYMRALGIACVNGDCLKRNDFVYRFDTHFLEDMYGRGMFIERTHSTVWSTLAPPAVFMPFPCSNRGNPLKRYEYEMITVCPMSNYFPSRPSTIEIALKYLWLWKAEKRMSGQTWFNIPIPLHSERGSFFLYTGNGLTILHE